MPRTADLVEVRRILETDRKWAAYALADLEPEQTQHCIWLRSNGEQPAIALIYRAFVAPVLLFLGSPECLQALFDEIDEAFGDARDLTLVAPVESFPLLEQRYEIIESKRMRRMTLAPDQATPRPDARATRLKYKHLDAIQRLYSDGKPTREAPDFFTPTMLEHGVYFGAWEGDLLTAVAGTHIVAPTVGVGAIGNVYTRRDRRGHGLAAAVTNAVVMELRNRDLPTVVLNVWSPNSAAIKLYERLGFHHYCDFHEVIARVRDY